MEYLQLRQFWTTNYKGPTIYLLANGCCRLSLLFWQSLTKNEL
jgi:hypothetical protein